MATNVNATATVETPAVESPAVESPQQIEARRIIESANALIAAFGINGVAAAVSGRIGNVKMADLLADKSDIVGRACERIDRANLKNFALGIMRACEALESLDDERSGALRGANIATGMGNLSAAAIVSKVARTDGGKNGLEALAI